MAVAIILDFPGATLEQYDRVLELMHLEPGGSGPPGSLFHMAMKTDDGMRVIDAWESRELFDRFAAEQIQPYTQQVGIDARPTIHEHALHSHMGAGAAVHATA